LFHADCYRSQSIAIGTPTLSHIHTLSSTANRSLFIDKRLSFHEQAARLHRYAKHLPAMLRIALQAGCGQVRLSVSSKGGDEVYG